MPETDPKRPRGRPRANANEVMDAFIGVRMPQSLLDRLTREAEEKGMTRNALVLEKLKK